MADVVEMPHASTPAPAVYDSTAAPVAPSNANEIVFHGTPKNMVVGSTMLLAGIMAFPMGMTDVFFAEAIAWTFIIWGALFLLSDILEWNRNWVVSDEGIRIGVKTPLIDRRPNWDRENINRMDLVVKRYEPKPQDVVMQVYYTAPGDSVLAREDRRLSPELARIIITRANLKATHVNNPTSFETLAPEKATYVWNKSGKFTAAL